MNTTDPIACAFRLASPPPSGSAAIAVIALDGDIDQAIFRMSVPPVRVGEAALRRWQSVDELIIARFAPQHALLFPHAGPAIVRHVLASLAQLGCRVSEAADPRSRYPEAASLLEARLLAALAVAQSPLAFDLLLDQPGRWERAGLDAMLVLSPQESRTLRRLIDPPLVVALGPPNIGKSSLLNALAGRQVSIVADEPGTTRDHVGVHLNLGGLVVRYLDAPGLDADPAGAGPILAEAQALARRVAARADLLLLCADGTSEFPEAPSNAIPVIRVGLRDDLAGSGGKARDVDVSTSVRELRGLAELAGAIRDHLVPPALLADHRAWEFWEEPHGAVSNTPVRADA